MGSQQKALLIIGHSFVKGGQNWLIWLLMVLIRALTTVNRPKIPHNFHSRHKKQSYPSISSPDSVNIQKQLRRGTGSQT